jgi:hypothetical protein
MKTLFLSLIAIAFLPTQSIGQTLFEEYPGWYHFSPASSEIPDYKISCLEVGADGALWIGSNQSGGLAKLKDGQWTLFNTDNSPLTNNHILAMVVEDEVTGTESVWLVPASGAGVIRRSNGTWKKYRTSNSNINSSDILDLKLGADGSIWIVGEDFFQKYDPSQDDWLPAVPIPNTNYIAEFAIDNRGLIWYNRSGDPLYVFNPETQELFNMNDSVNGIVGEWFPMIETSGDSIFVSAFGNVSNNADDRKEFWLYDALDWSLWNRYNSEISGFPYHMDIANGSLWFACDWGISKYDGETFTNWDAFNSPIPLDDKTISSIKIDRENRMWIGTYLMGLYMLDLNEWNLSSIDDAVGNSATVFPNPAQGLINLRLPKVKDGELRVYDSIGNLVLQQTSSKTDKFSFSLSETGLFHYSFISDDHQDYCGKILNLGK